MRPDPWSPRSAGAAFATVSVSTVTRRASRLVDMLESRLALYTELSGVGVARMLAERASSHALLGEKGEAGCRLAQKTVSHYRHAVYHSEGPPTRLHAHISFLS